MTMFVPIAAASDRVMMTLIAGLEIEFGRGAGAALAARFLEAEGADFHWDARVRERWLGVSNGLEVGTGIGAQWGTMCSVGGGLSR